MFKRGSRIGRGALLALAAVCALLAAAFAAPAGAVVSTGEQVIGGQQPDMFTTNVPYVAWRGEQVKAVKCDGTMPAVDGDGSLYGRNLHANVLVEAWSGGARDPQLEAGTVKFFRSSSDLNMPCVGFDMVSSDAGLARVKLVVTNDAGEPILKHQFLMVWLTIGTVAISEATNSTPPVPPSSAAGVGDPLGDGNFLASSKPGRVKVGVTGTFPHPLGAGGTFTLPQDWPAIANALATDNNPYNGSDAIRWDIHDDQGLGDRHVGGFCLPTPSPFDDVDNCTLTGSSDELGPFSNVFGAGVRAAGPFDPARPATLLSNGVIDAGDAPMPALRVDVGIAPNSGAIGDISGVGTLTAADKSVVYSRDGNGGTSPAHNLYAPYYKQWIPATASPKPEASGIDGPQRGNDFEGFFLSGQYDNWDTFPIVSAPWVDTHCNQYVDFHRTLGFPSRGYDVPRAQPFGPQTVALYTDEHGEAQVQYNPNEGFYWDSLPVILNANRGCDPQGIDVLGTSNITATARYPYQPVDDSPRVSATIQKAVHNQFDKSLSYYPKGAGAANNNARIVVAHANDIDGRPFADELVCFMVDNKADGVLPFAGTTGPAAAPFYVDTRPSPLTSLLLQTRLCARTDNNGNAAIEVFESTDPSINVIALYADEGLLRDIDVDFATPGSSGGTVPPVGNPAMAKPATGRGATAPSVEQIQQTAGAAAARVLGKSVTRRKAAVRRVAVARVLLRRGKALLVVKVRSPKKSEKIRIRAGKRSYVRRIRANHEVHLAGLNLGPKGGKVSVTLVG